MQRFLLELAPELFSGGELGRGGAAINYMVNLRICPRTRRVWRFRNCLKRMSAMVWPKLAQKRSADWKVCATTLRLCRKLLTQIVIFGQSLILADESRTATRTRTTGRR